MISAPRIVVVSVIFFPMVYFTSHPPTARITPSAREIRPWFYYRYLGAVSGWDALT